MQANRIIKKASILTIGYIFLFFGIFILQFKNGSTITERFGNMKAVFSVQIGQDGRQTFQNRLNVSFSGLSLFTDERNQIYATIGNTINALTFLDWQRLGDNSFRMLFSDDVKLDFSVLQGDGKGTLQVTSMLPENISSISIPYSFNTGFLPEKESGSTLTVTNKDDLWLFSAHEVNANVFSLSHESDIATYRFAPPSETFTFADIPDTEKSSAATYNTSLATYKNTLISMYRNAFRTNTTNFSESEVVAFVAAMAENGNYNQALDLVPSTFKNSPARTYVSAPYFNSLARANETLTADMNSIAALVRAKSSTEPIEVLAHPRMTDYVIINQKSEAVLSLLQNAASTIETKKTSATISLKDAITVLRFYNFLALGRNELSVILKTAADAGMQYIESLASLDGDSLVISEGGVLISAFESAQIGDAFVQYGKLTGNAALTRAGYLLMNRLFQNVASFDKDILAALYPVVVHGNNMYPHAMSLSDTMWAWTCARNAVYNRDSEGTITISFNFPVNSSHYTIIRGVQQFEQIIMYEVAYRSDPHYESYNASGYVYVPASRSLLLKSRHRSQVENILLRYGRARNLPTADAATPANTTTTTGE